MRQKGPMPDEILEDRVMAVNGVGREDEDVSGPVKEKARSSVLDAVVARLERCLLYAESLHPQHPAIPPLPLPSPCPSDAIHIVPYRDETQMTAIMRLMTADLSEPYSIYTYRYFIHNWPELCLLVSGICDLRECLQAFRAHTQQLVGSVICKLDTTRHNRRRGYIAMLAVDQTCRRLGIGTSLVRQAIDNMQKAGCDEVRDSRGERGKRGVFEGGEL